MTDFDFNRLDFYKEDLDNGSVIKRVGVELTKHNDTYSGWISTKNYLYCVQEKDFEVFKEKVAKNILLGNEEKHGI